MKVFIVWRNKIRFCIAKQLLKITNWILKVLFTEEEIETLEADYWKNCKYNKN